MSNIHYAKATKYNDQCYVNNITTALMALRDMTQFDDIPIKIEFGDYYIYVTVGSGEEAETGSFYLQDMYRNLSHSDLIYEWLMKKIEEMKGDIDV